MIIYGRKVETINWKNKTVSIVQVRISLAVISQETDNSNYIYNPPFIAFSVFNKQTTLKGSSSSSFSFSEIDKCGPKRTRITNCRERQKDQNTKHTR